MESIAGERQAKIPAAIAECNREVNNLGETIYSIAGKLGIAPPPIGKNAETAVPGQTINARAEDLHGIANRVAELSTLAELIRAEINEL